jgi:hypothetical protein
VDARCRYHHRALVINPNSKPEPNPTPAPPGLHGTTRRRSVGDRKRRSIEMSGPVGATADVDAGVPVPATRRSSYQARRAAPSIDHSATMATI